MTVQRHKFNTLVMSQGESVVDIFAFLKTLSEHCNFGGTVRDMLVTVGVWDQ